MAIGDRVRVGAPGIIEGTDNVVVYGLASDQEGNALYDSHGYSIVKSLGGVKPGTTGTIQGHPIRVHKSGLIDKNRAAGFVGSVDVVDLYPVFLDHYQQLGFFPSDVMRIFSGPEDKDRA